MLKYLTFSVGTLGLLDSLYLSYSRLFGGEVACVITHGCATVAESEYSVFLGVPLAYIGVAYYITVLALTYLKRWDELLAITLVGALMSLYFIYVQAFIIGAYCIYCLTSAGISFVLLTFAYVQYLRKNSSTIL